VGGGLPSAFPARPCIVAARVWVCACACVHVCVSLVASSPSGECFEEVPPEFVAGKAWLTAAGKVAHWGYAASRSEVRNTTPPPRLHVGVRHWWLLQCASQLPGARCARVVRAAGGAIPLPPFPLAVLRLPTPPYAPPCG
jgi:hypothetical protein